MSKKIEQNLTSPINSRIDYSKISGHFDLPFLAEIQTEAFQWFVEKGMTEVFMDRDVFPIVPPNEACRLEYLGHTLESPQYDVMTCRDRNLIYASKLTAQLRLYLKDGSSKDATIFMGNIPTMTESGTFVINGAERVIVSQIARSPGAYICNRPGKSGLIENHAELIPTRGAWLIFKTNQKGIIQASIDRQRKLSATAFIKALGIVSNEEFFDLFGDSTPLRTTLDKDDATLTFVPSKNARELKKLSPSDREAIMNADLLEKNEVIRLARREVFRKCRPGEPITTDGTNSLLLRMFFSDTERKYDLGAAGRYKFAQKLGIYERLVGATLAEDLVSGDGEIVYPENHEMTFAEVRALQKAKFFENHAHERKIFVDPNIEPGYKHNNVVNVVKVYKNKAHSTDASDITNIVGTDLNSESPRVTIPDILAVFSYFLNYHDGLGLDDDIDHLSNRRIRTVGELIQNHFRIGLTKIRASIMQKMTVITGNSEELQKATPATLVTNINPLTQAIRQLFMSSQLSQFMDQTNPLAELTNKRRISALGPGGLSRDRAKMEVRDVHESHYGRICPIETPEGQNIGLINNLACYAKINKYGFIETPYRELRDGILLDAEPSYYSANWERRHTIAQANVKIDANGKVLNEEVSARKNGENLIVDIKDVEFIDVSPKQIVSVASACIPFLENDDTTRALMGANMQRQALPLLHPEAPYVGTGMEARIAHDSGLAVVCKEDGLVVYADAKRIDVKAKSGLISYSLLKFKRSNQGTCINQVPIVKLGEEVKKGQILADGPAMDNGELALGQNVTIAFMTWNGYNYEDAVIMSERLVKEDVYTSIHIEKYEVACRQTKQGSEEITRDLPQINQQALIHLDGNGIVVPGSEVHEGDILVGKITPKPQVEPSPQEKLMYAIFTHKAGDMKDTSLRVPHGGAGTVLDVRVYNKGDTPLESGTLKVVHVYIVQKRKISEGDKMSGRHGNKGVISRILPVEDMPFLPDGTPVDIMLNPLGVPSRMNIGQILEVHLGYACKKLGMKIATPVFDGISNEEIYDLMNKAGLSKDGKTILFDGQTGERFDSRISVGVMYMIKLVHMVDDKLHARATGRYSLVTQQPLGGKAQNGGQRLGEMEVWALEAYGAANTLQEILTIKSDDWVGRNQTYIAIIKGEAFPKPSMPEAFKVLIHELRSLGINAQLFDNDRQEINLEELSDQQIRELRRDHLRKKERITGLEEEHGLDDADSLKLNDGEDNTSSIKTRDELEDEIDILEDEIDIDDGVLQDEINDVLDDDE